MSDKNEFARCVPAMFQESAFYWLLEKLSGDLEEYKCICAESPDCDEEGGYFPPLLLHLVTQRANAVRQTLLCLYSEKADQSVINVNVEGEPERVDKVFEAMGGFKCHTGSR
ncbi:TPA: hypothetical protein RQO74_000250 [Klebsiella michiganensis]|nr:hypothetical protein [Klebsiella michiganensis]